MNKDYSHLIVNDIHWEKELPDHEGSIGDKGFPILMNQDLVNEAEAWVCPVLMVGSEKINKAIKADKFGKANPHTHNGDEMYLILGEDGAAVIDVMLGQTHYEVSSPAAVYIPEGVPHAIQAKKIEEGKYAGACPVFLGSTYDTQPIKGSIEDKDYSHLIINDIHWEKELPDHEGSIGDKGFPILMNQDLVNEAEAWVCPVLMVGSEKINKAIKADKFGKANPHTHNGDEMYLILGEDGAAVIDVMLGQTHYEVSSPAAVYIPEGVPHAIQAKKIEEGKYAGACPVFLGSEYQTNSL